LKYNKVGLRLPELYRSSRPMGTITERKLADRSKRFLAQVGMKKNGKWLYRENQTFEQKRDARFWMHRTIHDAYVRSTLP
jgi:hypothetical protein